MRIKGRKEEAARILYLKEEEEETIKRMRRMRGIHPKPTERRRRGKILKGAVMEIIRGTMAVAVVIEEDHHQIEEEEEEEVDDDLDQGVRTAIEGEIEDG